MRTRRAPRTLRALWGSTHPGPTLVVTVLCLALGMSIGLDALRLAVLAAAVFAGQLSVGLSNDAIDALRDRAVGRSDKPVARGDVTVTAVWIASFASLVIALALSAVLGWRMTAAHALALGSAWSYNAALKSTAFSVVPFLVSFGIFPSLVTLSAPDPAFAPAWAWIAGAALGAAVHLVNVLPDLGDDARTGVRGLPHRLGARASAVVAAAGTIVSAVVVLVASSADASATPIAVGLSAAVIAVAVATVVVAFVRPPTRVLFRLVMLAALLLAAELVAAGPALTV